MEKIKLLKFDTKILIATFIGLGLLSLIISLGTPKASSSTAEPKVAAATASVDTFIPKGYVLFPIELINSESLSSLIGDLGGVVDLYLAGNDRQKGGAKIASRLKLVRAPLNPQQYAVLIREADSSRILSATGPFLAVVQNPESTGSEITQSKKNSIKIDYQN